MDFFSKYCYWCISYTNTNIENKKYCNIVPILKQEAVQMQARNAFCHS